MSASHAHDTFHHVRDAAEFELPFGNHITLPHIGDFQLTKFMVLQMIAAVFVLLVFRGLSKRIASGQPASGRWWNFWEAMALFVRDEVVRPTVGDGHHDEHGHDDHGQDSGHAHDASGGQLEAAAAAAHGHGDLALSGAHPADQYLPFVWSCFFYVLICNLLGAIPWLGSATGNINVTAALAICVFAAVVMAGVKELGAGNFVTSLAPTMDLPPAIRVFIVPMIWIIEVVGLFIKHGVLAVRLFANIMAGHTVIAVVLGFIALAAGPAGGELESIWWGVMPASILGQVAIGMLELFVAFLQAYVFAFLAALFIATAVHPH